MRAIVHSRYGSAEGLRLEEIPTPVPGDGDVLVRIRAASVNRTDVETLTGTPRMYRLFMGVRRPRDHRLGLDAAGDVEAIGAGVTRFAVGDRVYADLLYNGTGAFAEFACAKENAWRSIPDGIDFDTAATLPASAVLALQGLGGRDGVAKGDKVLINGAAGSVGIFAVQLAKAAGAEVTGVDHTDKLDFMRSIGVDHVIDYTAEDYTRGGVRYDRIVDAIAKPWVFAVRRALAENGVYGAHGSPSTWRLLQAIALGPLLSLGRKRRMGIVVGKPNNEADLATVGELALAGALRPVIDRTYTLDQVPEAVAYYAAGKPRGKLVIRM